MKKKWFDLKLGREAMLFDSPLYVMKTFLSIFTAYLLFRNHSIAGRDMISVLFGMMLTLEPINRAGLKNGWEQVQASVLGGVIGAVFIALLGVNALTIAGAVALTVYFALKQHWRFVSPVAYFTAIYMTQLLQYNAMGEPSVLLTLQLRLVSLGAGILVGVIFNYLFSLFFYKSMVEKRFVFAYETLEHLMNQSKDFNTEDQWLKHKGETIQLLMDLDMITKQVNGSSKRLEELHELRDLTHYYLSFIIFQLKEKSQAAYSVERKWLEERFEKLSG